MIQTQSEAKKSINLETLFSQHPHLVEITMGDFQATKEAQAIYCAKNITTGLCVMMYDANAKVGGMAHVILPDSEFQQTQTSGLKKPFDDSQYKACYADIAIPQLWEALQALGASVESTNCTLVGGSQLFTFGGGRGNPLNIGARNAITARTTLSRMGLTVKHTEIGGSRPRSAVLMLNDGRIFVQTKGGDTIQAGG
jgi:chemotaxis protein CheD